METTTLIAFAATFVGGPALCSILLRLPQRLWVMSGLAIGVAGTSTAAIWLQARTGPAALLGSLAMLWLAWVLAVALLAHAVLRRVSDPAPRRWITVLTLLATTLPWFGLATARMMV